ncbi:hypothetical protein D2V17_04895 [Aurantiacibacter xanthus]|uniref:DUF4124 domain-containing protein n=1 Tax=Aurantiacibacter xanthus TaxID=1784712 RepID=A0A3A1P9A9_9SPHN|nr:hypothetical protein [Aurantiacibacter xanthus]RIV90111.1 hypothetical protein D2V17_04895 [Aurantiacibacter xanthus]
MTRLFAPLAPLAAISATLGFMPAAASAQDDAGGRVNMINVYGDDACPQSDGDTITVCARYPESERYRIPRNLRQSNSPQNEAWSQRAQSLETVGKFGPMSCSPAGAGGDLGCTVEMIEAAYREREAGSDVRFSQLINEARQERLSEIDGEAAATQERVEELERAYMQRLEAERAAPLPDEGENEALPQVVDPANVPPPPGE